MTTTITTVRKAAELISSICDGAITEDSRGYNKLDSYFVKSLLRKNPWTFKQENAVYRILKKYEGQLLQRFYLCYSDIETEVKEPDQTQLAKMLLDFDTRKKVFVLKSQYEFREKAKAIPTAQWNPEIKCWSYLYKPEVYDSIIQYLPLMDLTAPSKAALESLKVFQNKLNEVEQIKTSKVENDLPVKTNPFDHQIKAFKIGMALDKSGLLMEQGTGKTLSAIAVAGQRFLNNQISRLLIISPVSVSGVWIDEFKKHADFNYEIVNLTKVKNGQRKKALSELNKSDNLKVAVINYESSWRFFDELLDWNPEMIITDESQKIKNSRAKQSKAVYQLGLKAKYKLILTGTPVTQSPLDIWSQYRFLNSDIFSKSFMKFRDRYARMGGYQGYEIMGYKNLEELSSKAHSIAYRITKKEALDLPETIDQFLKVKISDEAQILYDKMEKDFLINLGNEEKVTAPIVLTQMLRLQQITGGFLSPEIPGDKTYRQVDSAKLNIMKELFEDLPADKKIVVFARFIPEIKAIEKLAGETKRSAVVLYGETKNRDEVIRSFQDENSKVTVFIAQIQTGGLGITLTASDVAIFYSTNFSYSDYEQAKARLHRIGQKRSVTYIHLIAEETIDEEIISALKSKKEIAELVTDILRTRQRKDKEMEPEVFEKNLTQLKKEVGSADKNPVVVKKTVRPVAKPTAKAKAVKAEKPAAKKVDKNLVTVKKLAQEAKLTPFQVRRTLRSKIKRDKGLRWEWPTDSKDLDKVRKIIADSKVSEEPKPKAKKK